MWALKSIGIKCHIAAQITAWRWPWWIYCVCVQTKGMNNWARPPELADPPHPLTLAPFTSRLRRPRLLLLPRPRPLLPQWPPLPPLLIPHYRPLRKVARISIKRCFYIGRMSCGGGGGITMELQYHNISVNGTPARPAVIDHAAATCLLLQKLHFFSLTFESLCEAADEWLTPQLPALPIMVPHIRCDLAPYALLWQL